MITGLEAVRLRRRALPERELAAVSLRTRLFDRTLEAPLVGELPELAPAEATLWRAAELEGDALRIRLAPLEAVMHAAEIAAIVAHVFPRPVVARATDFEDVALLRESGVAAIEVATVDALVDARAGAPGLPLIFTGLGHGEEVAKCLALGATAAALDAAADRDTVIEQLRIATWLAGAAGAQELGREHLR